MDSILLRLYPNRYLVHCIEKRRRRGALLTAKHT